MALHFDREEFEGRRRRALEAMAAQGLDALLMFKQEKRVRWTFVAVPASC
jgi:Xaa-Pro aminopeptidase